MRPSPRRVTTTPAVRGGNEAARPAPRVEIVPGGTESREFSARARWIDDKRPPARQVREEGGAARLRGDPITAKAKMKEAEEIAMSAPPLTPAAGRRRDGGGVNIVYENNPACVFQCKTARCSFQTPPSRRAVRKLRARLRRLRVRRNNPWVKYCRGVLADLEKAWAAPRDAAGRPLPQKGA